MTPLDFKELYKGLKLGVLADHDDEKHDHEKHKRRRRKKRELVTANEDLNKVSKEWVIFQISGKATVEVNFFNSISRMKHLYNSDL